MDRMAAASKEARSEAGRQEEATRRLRALLGQARGLLREAGVPFMEDAEEGDGGGSGKKGKGAGGRVAWGKPAGQLSVPSPCSPPHPC